MLKGDASGGPNSAKTQYDRQKTFLCSEGSRNYQQLNAKWSPTGIQNLQNP
jgi:hypothetical protein